MIKMAEEKLETENLKEIKTQLSKMKKDDLIDSYLNLRESSDNWFKKFLDSELKRTRQFLIHSAIEIILLVSLVYFILV